MLILQVLGGAVLVALVGAVILHAKGLLNWPVRISKNETEGQPPKKIIDVLEAKLKQCGVV
jgi:hypothetical protein